jgi:hypothetical protein
MGLLRRFEDRVERLVHNTFATVLRREIQSAEIVTALHHECDRNLTVWNEGRVIVPNEFTIGLRDTDHEQLAPHLSSIGQELANHVQRYVQRRGYSFLGPLQVNLTARGDLWGDRYRISSDVLPDGVRAPRVVPASEAGAGLFQPTARPVARWLEIGQDRYPIQHSVTVLGRSTQADLRIVDPGVSRHHAQVRIANRPAVLDLGSRNGLTVDGTSAARSYLHDGSEIVLGTTHVIYRQSVA